MAAGGTRVRIHISCDDLPNADYFSKSDPLCMVYLRDPLRDASWTLVGRTECVADSLSPVFRTPIPLEYRFEKLLELKFEVVDVDDAVLPTEASSDVKLEKYDFLGWYQTTLGRIVAARAGHTARLWRPGSDRRPAAGATITLRSEEADRGRDVLRLTLRAEGLPRMDFFGLGQSDPYLQFLRPRGDGTWLVVHETEVLKGTLTPRWAPLEVPVSRLGEEDLRVRCMDWNRFRAPGYIGEFSTSVGALAVLGGRTGAAAAAATAFTLTRPHLPGRPEEERSRARGRVLVEGAAIRHEYGFLDFLSAGMEVTLAVAIDLTGSNGHPADADSLHYRGAGAHNRNPYQRAIAAVGEIVAPYATRQRFPVWGFGAQPAGPHSTVSHCLPLTFDPATPEVDGVAGILAAYGAALQRVTLSGPTRFSEVIREASRRAAVPYTAAHQHYTILLLLTDGVLDDMEDTVAALVEASTLPLSVIIVGVGGADFSLMEELDGDRRPLETAGGRRVSRDIVQFVPMRDFADAHPARLAAETLAEVPGQLLSFCKLHSITPLPTVAPAAVAAAAPPTTPEPSAPPPPAYTDVDSPPPYYEAI